MKIKMKKCWKSWLELVEKVDLKCHTVSIDWLENSKNSTWVWTLCMPLGIFCEGQSKKMPIYVKLKTIKILITIIKILDSNNYRYYF